MFYGSPFKAAPPHVAGETAALTPGAVSRVYRGASTAKLKRTYRDIAAILAEKCDLQVSASGIHDFVRARSQGEETERTRLRKLKGALTNPTPKHRNTASNPDVAAHTVQQRIAALRQRDAVAEPTAEGFQFDPCEPLRLRQLVRKRRDE